MIQLRDYQKKSIDEAREKLRRVRRVLLQTPTGGGKTVIASYIIEQSLTRGQPVWFICHRAELVTQTSLTFRKFGIPHGFIASGRQADPSKLIHICSIDTLKNRLHLVQIPKTIIWDEAHHVGAAGWAAVMKACEGARHLGLSATPERHDGKGLDAHFDDIVLGPQPGWLINQDHLSDYRMFCPPAPAGLKAGGMDDGRSEQAKIMDKPKLTGDVVSTWLKRANGLRTVGFACNVQHSLHMVEAFKRAGIPAAHLDGGSDKADRKKIIQDFADGKILVLWNVSLFGEGFDLSAIAQKDVTIDCVILNRLTRSLGLFLQMVGRALRPSPGKIAIINDHAGNGALHGYPDDDREWSLAGKEWGKGRGKKPEDGPPPPVTCTGCFMQVRRPVPLYCPHCSAELAPPKKAMEVEDGELTEITPETRKAMRAERQREERDCESVGALVALAQRRGYPSPTGWALKRWAVHPKSKQSKIV